MKPFKNILVTPLKKLVRGESAVPIVERLKGIAFLVGPCLSRLTVVSILERELRAIK